MSDETTTLQGAREDAELYARINITKNTKGYQAETTASVRMTGSVDEIAARLQDLLVAADAVVRVETSRRERLDAEGVAL